MDREVLTEALAVMANTLPSRTTYPVLQNVLLEVSGSKLAVSGTDLDTFVRREFSIEGKTEDGQALLPGRKLMEMVRVAGAGDLRIFSKDKSVHVETSNSKAVFVGLDPVEFPEMPKLPEGQPFELSISAVLDLFEHAGFAVSGDDNRPAMCGVNMEVTKTEMRMVATDGHRLSLVKMKGKFDTTAKFILTSKLFSLLPKGGDTVSIYSDPAKVGFVCPGTTIIGRQIEGPYPDYNRVIPKDKKMYRAEIPRDELIAALRRAAVFAHPVGRLTALSFTKGELAIHSETPEVGSSDETLACKYSGKEVRIGFNAGYVLETLRHIGSEKVSIDLQGPLAAAVVRPIDEGSDIDKTFLLMPIRLD
jgi:DNA polymerase-3 subunit beta